MSPYDFLSFPMTSQDLPGPHRTSEAHQQASYKLKKSKKIIGNPMAFQGLNNASFPGRLPERVRRRPPRHLHRDGVRRGLRARAGGPKPRASDLGAAPGRRSVCFNGCLLGGPRKSYLRGKILIQSQGNTMKF